MVTDVPTALSVAGTLAEYTQPELLVPRLRETDTAGIIGELSHAFQRQGCVADVLAFYHTALNQELLSSSALQCGVALPHARLGGIKQLRFALGRTPEPVAWGVRGSGRAQLIFLLAVPATDAAGYLQLLASLARLGQQPEVLEQLRRAESAEALLTVLERIRLRPE